ncbi:MAG: hypothetical protein HW412_995, partial [Bacteroidetes bacterium]|nr:hypothetical protein [Bacteroidota bacterium]
GLTATGFKNVAIPARGDEIALT